MATDTWDPRQYERFQQQREQPFFDLLALVHAHEGMRVVDLGCGTGKLTRTLHERLQARDTLGRDRSARMLDEARSGPVPHGLRFEVGTIESFDGTGYDLVFSNAAFHWVEDHQALVRRLTDALAPGGQLAFQVPAQHDGLSHVIAEALTRVEPFRTAFGGWHRAQPVLRPEAYSRLLYESGLEDPIVRLIVYPHVLASRAEVVEWMKGTLLTEYARRLPGDLFERFVEEYRMRLLAHLNDSRPFFFPFKRILVWGQRA